METTIVINQKNLVFNDEFWLVPEKEHGLEVIFRSLKKPSVDQIIKCNKTLEKIDAIRKEAFVFLDNKKDFKNLEKWELICVEFHEGFDLGQVDLLIANESLEEIYVLWRVSCVKFKPINSTYEYW